MLTRTVMLFALAAVPASAQMEKRMAELYDAERFAKAAPAVGSVTPDLQLCDLDGRPRCLLALRGRTVVLIKGSYT
jgi:hypothetical protein